MAEPASTSFDPQFMLRALPGQYLILNTDLIMLDASKDYLAVTGKTNADLVGKYVFDVFPENSDNPESRNIHLLRDTMVQAIKTKKQTQIKKLHYDIYDAAGNFEERYWDIIDTPILNNEGNVVGLIHHVTDVTAQVKEQQEARNNEELIRVVTQTINDVVWDWNLLTNEIWWSDGFNTKFGYAPQETEPTIESWYSRIHPEDAKNVTEGIHKVIEANSDLWSDTYRFKLKNGQYADILDRGAVLRDETGKGYRMIGAMVDITVSKRSEREIKESEERLRSVMESMPQMAWSANPDGTIYYYNQQWPKYIGVTIEELYEKGWQQFMHPQDLIRTAAIWQDALETGQDVEIEHRYLKSPENEYKWFLTRGVAQRNSDGEIVNWTGTCTYIDDQKKLTEKLQEQEEKVQRILSQAPAHFCLIKGPEQIIDFATPGIKQLFGNRDCVGLPITEAWPEIAEQGLTQKMQEVYQSGKPQFFWENSVMVDRENNGTLTEGFYDFTYQPFRDFSGETEGVLVLAIEVTAQVLAKREALKLSEELLEEKERFQFLADTIKPEMEEKVFKRQNPENY